MVLDPHGSQKKGSGGYTQCNRTMGLCSTMSLFMINILFIKQIKAFSSHTRRSRIIKYINRSGENPTLKINGHKLIK